MGRGLVALSVVGCVLGAAGTARGLEVRIVAPHGGVVPGPTVELVAEVSDPRATEAMLVANGASYHVPIEQGRIEQRIVAVPGNNRVGVVVRHGRRIARDSTTFRYEGEPIDLVVLLTWPSRGEIVDLWVREPGGETCKWDHRETASGGRLLDFSTDAIGFGSQAFVLPEARAGSFRIKVHYWGAYSEEDQRGHYQYDELMRAVEDLDGRIAALPAGRARRTLEAERRRTIDQIDRWATPAAPQTPVHAEVVLFPGTRSERRWRFDVTVHRVGQLTTLGQVEIAEEMIRAARER